MGSSFEDLDALSPMVKTDHKSDKPVELQNILNFQISYLMRMTSAILSYSACMLICLRGQKFRSRVLANN